MPECSAMRENMPFLLTESLDPVRRESAHQHIENCAVCSAEWNAYRETWTMLDELPVLEVPQRVKASFLARAGISEAPAPQIASPATSNVVPFHRRGAFKWVAQAAAVAVLVGGAYFAGDRNADRIQPTQASIDSVTPLERATASGITPVSLAETRVLDANALSPEIQGRPVIRNVQCVDCDGTDGQIAVAFDVTTRWTVTGHPKDKSMLRLSSYMLENEDAATPRSDALESLRRMYSDPAHADPEIANALAKVLSSDAHEGVRIDAVETLTHLPGAVSTQTRDALIQALKSDPNPAVRLKAVEALANMLRDGAVLEPTEVDVLRQKALQEDENPYVRVKVAEALSTIK
jgi:hypothetical protein